MSPRRRFPMVPLPKRAPIELSARRVRPPQRQDDRPTPGLCECRVETVRCEFVGWGMIVCKKCKRPPAESLGVWWTEAALEEIRQKK